MEGNNICRFIPQYNDYETIHTINFVLETQRQEYESLKSNSVYRMHYVKEGEGILHTPGSSRRLRRGDLFFVLPAVPFAIESVENFQYLYISYIGTRANRIMEQLKISGQNCIFSGFEEVEAFWMESLQSNTALFDLRTESVLLYTFSVMGIRFFAEDHKEKKTAATAETIKKYIDDNFSDTDLSLEKVGEVLCYNKKYVSMVFKKKYKIGIAEYLNVVRIQHACTLIEQKFTSVRDVAQLCGFKDPLYFSRVFRSRMGRSPREHMSDMVSK
ncbi:MAG: AraC family transcriptional regulator [Lachnospiraceae bacterium]|nr:AraC family transcriptional regulator [Lachnospiraceae bacterium]